MSNSADSLKKKVCVTVFLDELFEEVKDEDDTDPNQVSEVTESEVKIAEQAYKKSSEYDLDNHEKINISPNPDTKENEPELRPRKHRRESKFSRNPCESFKNGLDKYECGSSNKVKFKCAKPVESRVSDSDLDQCLALNKCWSSGNQTSFSELTEIKEENFHSVNLKSLSSMMACSEKKRSGLSRMFDDNVQSDVITHCSRSTQFDGRKKDVEKAYEKFESELLVTESQEKKIDEDLMWKKTRKQIQLILAKARSRYEEREVCDRDQKRHFDLRSILKNCEKHEIKTRSIDGFESYADLLPKASMGLKESEVQSISDSYTCAFSHERRRSQNQALEVKRVWANSEKNVWNDGFESDASDQDFTRIDPHPLKTDSSLCYALCVKCGENIFKKAHKELNTNENSTVKIINDFKSACMRDTSTQNKYSQTSLEFENTRKNSSEVSPKLSSTEHFIQKNVEEDEKEAEEDIAPVKNSEMLVKRKNIYNDKDDAVEKSSKKELHVEKTIASDENETITDENHKECDEIEVTLIPKSKTRKDKETNQSTHKSTEGIAEVFSKAKKAEENTDRNMTDAESEMVFAESEDFRENEDFLNYKFYFESSTSHKAHSEPPRKGKDVCVIEIEDKLSRSNIIKKIKSVEIRGDGSMRGINNISTQVVLICENVSNNDLCLEAWQSSASNLKSTTEMGQCYLKDSKNSSMYLIEIPLPFNNPQGK